MAIANVKAFYEALQSNTELQEKVNAADAAYNGDATDKAAAVAAILIPAAKEAGFDFTAEELLEFEKAAAQKSDDEISEDELEAVAGGVAICLLLGFGTGKSSKNESGCRSGGGVCKYVGVGMYFFD